MSAETIQKLLVDAHQRALSQLTAFDRAINQKDHRAAAEALQNAAKAICDGLTQIAEDAKFWAEAGELVNKAVGSPDAIKTVCSDLDKVADEEAKILAKGGYSAESIRVLLGEFEITLDAFQEFPSGNTLELARRKVIAAQKAICDIASKPVEIVKEGFWGRTYRRLKAGLKTFNGAGTVVCDVATASAAAAAAAATGGALTPLAIGVAAVSVAGGVHTIMSVGEEIHDGLVIRRR
jgi:hypothetical protein